MIDDKFLEASEKFESCRLGKNGTFSCALCGDDDLKECDKCEERFEEGDTVHCDGEFHICEKCFKKYKKID